MDRLFREGQSRSCPEFLVRNPQGNPGIAKGILGLRDLDEDEALGLHEYKSIQETNMEELAHQIAVKKNLKNNFHFLTMLLCWFHADQ
jgi:hypothetical protein